MAMECCALCPYPIPAQKQCSSLMENSFFFFFSFLRQCPLWSIRSRFNVLGALGMMRWQRTLHRYQCIQYVHKKKLTYTQELLVWESPPTVIYDKIILSGDHIQMILGMCLIKLKGLKKKILYHVLAIMDWFLKC